MSHVAFSKSLSANDVGSTGSHQCGVHIPKGEFELLKFLPTLDPCLKNPDAWLHCVDDDGVRLCFRFVYYNNRLHADKGTRDEYRITRMTAWFRQNDAREGDVFEISRAVGEDAYAVRLVQRKAATVPGVGVLPTKVRLQGWRRLH